MCLGCPLRLSQSKSKEAKLVLEEEDRIKVSVLYLRYLGDRVERRMGGEGGRVQGRYHWFRYLALWLSFSYFSSLSLPSLSLSLTTSHCSSFSLSLSLTTHEHRRERHDIPLIVQTCVDEVERRGMSEVGVYRVAGVLRDVQELRQAFDTGRAEVTQHGCTFITRMLLYLFQTI